MPSSIVARYRARDGTNHRVVVRPNSSERSLVLDVAHETIVVETLSEVDRLPQAQALARDYAAEQKAFHLGLRDDPLPKTLPATQKWRCAA